jgi:hypothetical protein
MAATGIGDIVSDLSLPTDMQTVMVHSITDEIIIGIVIGIPALTSIGVLAYALRERKARTEALGTVREETQGSRPERDASPRAVEAPSITAHQSCIGLETAGLSARQRGLTERQWRKQWWTNVISAAARPHRPNLPRPPSSPEFRTSMRGTDTERPAMSRQFVMPRET